MRIEHDYQQLIKLSGYLKESAIHDLIYYMNVQEQIKKYITSQPEAKRNDMQELHQVHTPGITGM